MTKVFFANDPATAWQRAARPWFKFWSRGAWNQQQPVAFLGPTSLFLGWVKRRLVLEGIPALGIQFWTPGALRSHLRRALGETQCLAVREDLHLLLELAAEKQPDNPVARAALLDPSDFLRVYDQLDTAGWGPDSIVNRDARALAGELARILAQTGLMTTAQADRALASRLADAEPPLAQVFAMGFGPAQVGALTLLRALPHAARSVAIGAFTGDEGDCDLPWRATLEALGEVEILPEPEPERTYFALARAVEDHTFLGEITPAVAITVAPNVITEARAILDRIQAILAESGPDETIGVVFAQGGQPLAREVARLLCDVNIAHQDEIGHQPGRTSAQQLFEAWCEYQKTAEVDAARRFFRELRRAGFIDETAEQAVRSTLENAFNEAMTTDLEVLIPLVDQQPRGGKIARQCLGNWPLLPQRGSLETYGDLCGPSLSKIGWPERPDALAQRQRALTQGLTATLSRERYLRWLGEVCRVPGRTRHALGREPFSPITLTTVAHAVSIGWDHLVFAGVNQGDWPPDTPENILLGSTQAAQLNQRSVIPSPSGTGEFLLRPHQTLLYSGRDERSRFVRQCGRLLNSATRTIAFTAHVEDAEAPGRERDIGDWLLAVIFARHGRLPAESEIRNSAKVTAAAFAPERPSTVDFPELAHAYRTRRDPDQPFDEYSYCFAQAPEKPLILSCKAWEEAIRLPTHAWLRRVLRVEPEGSLARRDPRSRAAGIWAHTWASLSPNDTFLPLPTAESWARSVEQRAWAVRHRIATAYAEAGRTLPDWWLMDWSIARIQARQFAVAAAAHEWPTASSEWSLPRQPIPLPGHPLDGLTLSGRIDLLLADAPATALTESIPAHWPPRVPAWIVDFKTGSDKPLTPKRLARGEGLQLALYALALHALGAQSVQTSLLQSGETIDPQVSLEEMQTLDGLWRGIARIATTGCFGARAEQESQFGFSGEYPVANLPIKPAILDAKWRLTHPELASE